MGHFIGPMCKDQIPHYFVAKKHILHMFLYYSVAHRCKDTGDSTMATSLLTVVHLVCCTLLLIFSFLCIAPLAVVMRNIDGHCLIGAKITFRWDLIVIDSRPILCLLISQDSSCEVRQGGVGGTPSAERDFGAMHKPFSSFLPLGLRVVSFKSRFCCWCIGLKACAFYKKHTIYCKGKHFWRQIIFLGVSG